MKYIYVSINVLIKCISADWYFKLYSTHIEQSLFNVLTKLVVKNIIINIVDFNQARNNTRD